MAKKKTKNQPKKKQVNAENVIGLHSEVTDQPITQTLEVNYMLRHERQCLACVPRDRRL